jgi:hypothetical protein
MTHSNLSSNSTWASPKAHVRTRLNIDPEIKGFRQKGLYQKGEYVYAAFYFYQHFIEKAKSLHPCIDLVRCQFQQRTPFQSNEVALELKIYIKVVVPLIKDEFKDFEGTVRLATCKGTLEPIKLKTNEHLLSNVEREADEMVRSIAGAVKQSSLRLEDGISGLQKVIRAARAVSL